MQYSLNSLSQMQEAHEDVTVPTEMNSSFYLQGCDNIEKGIRPM